MTAHNSKSSFFDPVCGMLVDEDSEFVFKYRDEHYHFCSDRCRNLFKQDPGLFISMQQARNETLENKRRTSLRNMTSQLSHEIRNPLTSIGGFARRVLRRLPAQSKERQYMERVVEDVERLEKMVNRLVKIQKDELQMTGTDINSVVQEVVGIFEEMIKDREIELKIDIQQNLPTVQIDLEKMKLALSNIVKNAIEAMESPPRRLSISTSKEGHQVVITIEDTGKGIPEDKLDYIFDPLFTSKVYGPGLGLAYTKEVVELHRGSIEVKSAVGKGTTFKILLVAG